MTEVLEFPPLADAPAALTPIAVASRSAVTIKEAAVSHLRAQESTILALAERYRNVALVLDTPKGLAAGQAALTEVRENGRFAVQRARDATKDMLNAAKKDVETESDRLIALIKPTEDHIDGQVSARKKVLADEKAERERIAAEAARIEAERVERHRAEIAKITAYPRQAQGQPAAKINTAIHFVLGLTFGPEWEEFCDEAAEARDTSIARLSEMHAAALNREAEAARVEAQRVENARVAAELAETQRKLDEQAAALKQRQDDIDRAEREKQAQRDAEAAAARFTTTPAEVYNPAPEACSSSAHDNQTCDSPVAESEQQADPSEALQAVAAQSLDMPEAAALDPREAWAEFEGALLRVMPKIQKHAAAGDLCRFITSLERMREVMA